MTLEILLAPFLLPISVAILCPNVKHVQFKKVIAGKKKANQKHWQTAGCLSFEITEESNAASFFFFLPLRCSPGIWLHLSENPKWQRC